MHETVVRRRHSEELKARVVAECRRPGASVSAVSMAHGLNANLVRKWLAGKHIKGGALAATEASGADGAVGFIALPLPSAAVGAAAEPPAPGTDIRLEIRRGAVVVNVTWPMTEAGKSAAWLREVLK